MKRVLLVRHIKSNWDNPLLKDKDRPIQKSRISDLIKVISELKKREIIPHKIISSDAKRTKETALILAKDLGIENSQINFDEQLYEFNWQVLFEKIKAVKESDEITAIVGHNTSMEDLLRKLSIKPITKFPTSACAYLTSSNNEDWSVEWIIIPKMLN
jgi:phosphohistidine phosphatase